MDEPAEGGDAAGTDVGGGPCEDTGGSSGGETILMPTYKKYRYLHQSPMYVCYFGIRTLVLRTCTYRIKSSFASRRGGP